MPPYRDLTVGALATRLAEALPDHEALVHSHGGLRLTFAQLEAEARTIARGLLACGIERGERVALWATNVPEWVVLQFALAKIGAVLVTVNTGLRTQEIDYLLRQSEAATLITIRGFRNLDYLGMLREIDPPALTRTILIGDPQPGDQPMTPYASLRTLADQVSDAQLDDRERQIGVDDVINMQYTSGTTGFPKGVMLSSRNIVNNAYALAGGLGFTPADRLCLCVPLFHCFGCVIGVLGAYTYGATLCVVESFDARTVLETVERERCTALYGVPTMFLAELEDPDFLRFNLTSLRTGIMAGALCPEPLMKRVMAEMHLDEITIAYGLTEASPGITHTHRQDTIERRTQTVGRVLPEMDVKIADPISGVPLGTGEAGELCVRGYNVMLGYYNNPEATRSVLGDDGWLRTGDQATIDADGYVRITGRIKDIIIRGGENISPKEVEDLVRRHPAVSDVSVYAVASEFFGEEVGASIRLKETRRPRNENTKDTKENTKGTKEGTKEDTKGTKENTKGTREDAKGTKEDTNGTKEDTAATKEGMKATKEDTAATREDIIAFCEKAISKHKVPRHIRFVPEFPLTASGKIQKFKLREDHERELGTLERRRA